MFWSNFGLKKAVLKPLKPNFGSKVILVFGSNLIEMLEELLHVLLHLNQVRVTFLETSGGFFFKRFLIAVDEARRIGVVCLTASRRGEEHDEVRSPADVKVLGW